MLAGCQYNRLDSGQVQGSATRIPAQAVRYILAIALVAAALGITFLLQGVVSTTGYIFFYAAVIASAWFGGKWPGWVAAVLGALAVAYYFLPPVHSFAVRKDDLPVFVEFGASAALVSWFSSWRRDAEVALKQARDQLEKRVEERTAELKRANQQLLEEISERKRAQEAYSEAQAELARVSRMSALGTLAAAIAHEVNQPLAAVVTNADASAIWLSGDSPNVEEARAAVDCIAREGTRASEVIRRIRALFSNSGSEKASVQLNEVIGEVMGLVQDRLSRNNIEPKLELAEDLPRVPADRIQVQQVIFNLVLNAIEAMSSIASRPRLLVIRSAAQPPNEVLIAVSDTGPGIDPKDEKRVFNAFFTTKEKGMGMGLSISRSIIESQGGRLWAGPNPDGGATFQLTLPVEPGSPS